MAAKSWTNCQNQKAKKAYRDEQSNQPSKSLSVNQNRKAKQQYKYEQPDQILNSCNEIENKKGKKRARDDRCLAASISSDQIENTKTNKRFRDDQFHQIETQKKKKELIYPVIDENNPLRRSTRIRFPRLEHWNFERPQYKLDSFGNRCAVGIHPAVDFPIRKKKPRIMKKTNPTIFSATSIISIPINSMPVINPETNGVVYADLVSKYNLVRFFGPNGEKDKETDPYVMSVPLEQRSVSCGFLIIRPLCEKPLDRLTDHSLIFNVLSGRVVVTVYCTSFEARKRDFFLVPIGNKYRLQNLTNTEIVLSFTRINV